jgi:hypothetical protein
MEIDWAPFDSNASFPTTPSKNSEKSDTASSKGKRKISFDPFADLGGSGSSLSFQERLLEAKSDTQGLTAGREYIAFILLVPCANYCRFGRLRM